MEAPETTTPEATPAKAKTAPATVTSFNDFEISDKLKQRLAAANFVTPTPVQAAAIPPALEGNDVLATAATGTGKTLSFLIPMLESLEMEPLHPVQAKPGQRARSAVRALILLPTRELAMQVLEALQKLAPEAKNDAVLVCGGLGEGPQIEALRRGPRVVVATPGRLEDYLKRNEINLRHVEILVLDEVDRMLDMGFLPSIRRIVGALPSERQTMCYSATLDANISEVVKNYVYEPVRVQIGTTSKPSDRVTLRAYTVMQDQKLALLDQLLREDEGTYLVFARTKHGADRLARKLEKLGHSVAVIHGDRSQGQRTSALKSFSTGKSRVLAATDVAARGIDISHIAHVVNYDLPNASDDFVHRIGRTGRAEKTGVATTFVMPQERADARKLERDLKISFDWREADRDLAKEERNRPVDLGQVDNLLQLESRAWKDGGDSAESAPSVRPRSSRPGSRSGAGGSRSGAGSSRSGSGSGSGSGAGSWRKRRGR